MESPSFSNNLLAAGSDQAAGYEPPEGLWCLTFKALQNSGKLCTQAFKKLKAVFLLDLKYTCGPIAVFLPPLGIEHFPFITYPI